MRRLVLWAAAVPLVFLLASCGPNRRQTPEERELFGPKSMRIHPTFTRVKDWTGDGKPDGIEAVVEVQDQFGEPIRATGSVMFELYQYRETHPDVRGRRIPEVWVWPLVHREEQAAHWSRALRAYAFKIPFDQGRATIVLEATFELGADRGRLTDRLVLEPPAPSTPVAPPATAPTTAPAAGAGAAPSPPAGG
jgi:hypothetical protein